MPENEFDFNVNFSFDFRYFLKVIVITIIWQTKNKELLVCFDLEENKKWKDLCFRQNIGLKSKDCHVYQINNWDMM